MTFGGEIIPVDRINDGNPVLVDNGGNWSASVNLPLSKRDHLQRQQGTAGNRLQGAHRQPGRDDRRPEGDGNTDYQPGGNRDRGSGQEFPQQERWGRPLQRGDYLQGDLRQRDPGQRDPRRRRQL